MKKRPFFLFSILLCSVLTFISCAHDTPQNASVSFLMSRETIHAILQRASRVNTSRSKNVELSQNYDFDDSEGELSEARVLVKLLYDGTATEKTLEETEVGFEATFTGIAIGSRVKAEVYLYIDDFLFMTGTSEEKVVTAGTNTLNVRMEDAVSGGGGSGDSHESGDSGESGSGSEGSGDSGHTGGESEQTYPADGTIELHITRFKLSQNTTLSSSTFYQNYGTLVLSLFDEDDEETDIFADIDWDNADNQEKFHDNITCTAKYGTTEIDLVLRNNTISMDYETPAGFTGRCQVFVTVTSDSIENYVNTSGDVVDLPYFEPVTASFNIDVEKGIVIDVGKLHDLGENAEYPGINIEADFEGYHTFNTLTIGINNILKNSNPFVLSPKIIFKGQTDLSYTDFMKGVLYSMTYFEPVMYDLDMSGVTIEIDPEVDSEVYVNAKKIVPVDNQNNAIAIYGALPKEIVCGNVNSIIFPADLTEIGESAFSGWEALNSVSFPENSALKIIGKYAFMSCPTLEITLPGNLIAIASRAFYCSSNLNPNLTINLADSSGTWYYAGNNETVGEDQWNAWLAGSQTPPDHNSSVVCGEESDIVNALKTTTTGNIYWFRVKD